MCYNDLVPTSLELFPDIESACTVEVIRSHGKILARIRGVNAVLIDEDDVGAKHCAVVAIAEAREVKARDLAEAWGLSEEYVSRLRGRYRRDGSAALIPPRPGPKRKSKLTPECIEKIQELKSRGYTYEEIAPKVGVSIASVSRALTEDQPPAQPSEKPIQMELGVGNGAVEAPAPSSELPPEVETGAVALATETESAEEPSGGCEDWLPVQNAGAMLLHMPLGRLGLVQAFEASGGRLEGRTYHLPGVIGTLAVGFGLGLANVEQFKLAVRGNLGPIVGLSAAPDVRTLRRKLSELSEQVDPVVVMRQVARGVLRLEPVWEGLYYVDGHFIPYHGELAVPKSRDPKRHCFSRGRTDTWVHDVQARPLFYLSSPVHDGLVSKIREVVAEIMAVAGDNSDIFLIFDRGGYSPELFAWLVEENVGFATYLKGPPDHYEPPTDSDFQRRWWSFEGGRHYYELAETKLLLGELEYRVVVKRDGDRQIPIITNDWTSSAARVAHLVKLRWRQENGLKDLVHNSFIDGIVEYGGDEEPDPTKILHPDREKLKAQLTETRKARTELQAELGKLAIESPRGFKAEHYDELQQVDELVEEEKALEEAISGLPARVRRCEVEPDKMRVLLRTRRRNMINAIKIAVNNAEQWLARKFQHYLKDADEYRIWLRSLLKQPGEIRYETKSRRLLARIYPPDIPKVREALAALISELNGDCPKTMDGGWQLVLTMGAPDGPRKLNS